MRQPPRSFLSHLAATGPGPHLGDLMLQRLADGETIPDVDRKQAFDHVRGCDQCLRSLKYVAALADALRTADGHDGDLSPPPALLHRIVRTMVAERAHRRARQADGDDASSRG